MRPNPYEDEGPDLPFWSCVAVIVCLWALAAACASFIELKLSGRFLFANGSLRVTCRVQRDPENRLVEWGIAGYTSRARDMEGADAAITYEQLFEHVPCGATTAFCQVKNTAGEYRSAVQTFTVTGCDEN